MNGTALPLFKLAVALVAALACYELGRLHSEPRRRRVASGVLAACALLAAGAYFQFGKLPGGLVHRWEMYHYYVGSKYHAELGYERLYLCAAVADAEQGVASRPERRIRDLHTDETQLAEQAVATPEVCKSHFSPTRWARFKADIAFFRRGLGPRWQQAQLDHGYNPPPLWTATWGRLSQSVSATVHHLQVLAGLDWLLMAGVLLALALGFGLRAAAIGAVFWGTQAASEHGWTGGGLGRQDWLFFAVLGVGLLRRNHFAWGGAALAFSAQLRLFPAVLLGGAALALLAQSVQTGRVPRSARRMLAGAALAVGIGLGVSGARGGVQDYRDFWSHIQLRHQAVVTNHMGLRTVLSAAPLAASSAPQEGPAWVAERRERLERFGVEFRVLALAFAALVAGAIWQARRAWLGAALAAALVPLLLDPANYYYSLFLLLVPLMARRRAFGVLLCVTAAGGQLLSLRFQAPEMRFVALSCLYVGVSVLGAVSLLKLPSLSWFFGEARHAK